MTMNGVSHLLAAALIASLSFPVAAQTPRLAGGTAFGPCAGNALITAERPAGGVGLGLRNPQGYSPWSGEFRMALDAQGRFRFRCISTYGPSSFLNLTVSPVHVRCNDRSNLLRARYGPGRVEFQCLARDHRR